MADQFYIEEGYLEQGYFGYVADAGANLSTTASIACDGAIADTTGYYIPDYIEEGYYEAGGVTQEASATLSASAGATATAGAIRQGSATFDGVMSFAAIVVARRTAESVLDCAVTMSTVGVKTARTDVTLSNIVNLNIQAAKTATFDTSLSASFGLSTTATKLKLTDATLNSTATLEIAAQVANRRPRVPEIIGTPTINTTNKKFGTGSLSQGNGNYLEYYDSTDYKTTKTIDFWFKPISFGRGIRNYIYTHGGSSGERFRVYINRTGSTDPETYLIGVLRGTSTTNYTYTSSAFEMTDFTHFRVERGTDGIHVWINGEKDTPQSDTSIGSYPDINTEVVIGGDGVTSDTGTGYIDELYITSDLLTDTSTTSFTVPSQPYGLTTAQQNNTILLAHFDDFTDDVSEFFYADATLSSTASITALATKTVTTDASLSTLASLSTDVAEITQGAATLQAAAALSTTPVKTASAVVNISGAASFSVSVDAINPGDAYLETFASLTADAVKEIGGTVSTSAAFAISASAEITRTFDASINASASLSADGIKSILTSAALNANATFAATATKTAEATITLSALAATLTAGERQPPRMRLAAWLNTGGEYQGAGIVYDSYNNFYALGKDVNPTTSSDFVLVKANAIGDLQWQKSYSNFINYADYHELHYYNDHIYVLSGSTNATSNEIDDRTYITKISITDGSVVEARQIIASLTNSRIRNGYLYIAGNSTSETYETRVVRIDLSDLTTNDLSIDLDIANYDFFESFIDANSNGDIFLATHAQPNGTSERVTFLTKIASNGSHTVSKLIDYVGYSVLPQDAELDSQGRFLVYISSNSPNAQGIIQFDSSLNSYGWMRNVESDTDGTDYLKIAVDGDDNVIIINSDTRKVVVLDDTGTKVANYYDEAIASSGSQVAAKDEWYLTVGDGYWDDIISPPYDRVRNVWVTQTLVDDEDNPIYAPEDYAGEDGIFTYESSSVTVSSASVSPSSVTLESNTQSLSNLSGSVTVSDTSYTWRILARLITGFADDINAVAALNFASELARIRSSSASIASAATLEQNSEQARIRPGAAELDSVISLQSQPGLLAGGGAALDAAFAQSVDAQRIRDNEFNLSAISTFNSIAERLRDPGTIELDTAASVATAPVKLVEASATIDGVMTFSAVAQAQRTTEILLDAAAEFSATPNKNAVVSSIMNSAVTLTATAFNIVDFNSNLSVATTLEVADVDRIRPGAATMSAAASIDEVTVTQTKGFELVVDAEFTLSATATRIQQNDSGLNTAASLNVVGDRIRLSSAELDAQFDPFYANAYRVVSAEIDLSAFVVTVTAGDIIAIDPFRTLLIPQETRQLKILEEDRDLTIEQETRVLVI